MNLVLSTTKNDFQNYHKLCALRQPTFSNKRPNEKLKNIKIDGNRFRNCWECGIISFSRPAHGSGGTHSRGLAKTGSSWRCSESSWHCYPTWWIRASRCVQIVGFLCFRMSYYEELLLRTHSSTSMAVSRSDEPPGGPVPGLGVTSGVFDPVLRRFCPSGSTAEHRFWHSGDENDPARGGTEGVPHLQDPRGQGDRTDGDARFRDAPREGGPVCTYS